MAFSFAIWKPVYGPSLVIEGPPPLHAFGEERICKNWRESPEREEEKSIAKSLSINLEAPKNAGGFRYFSQGRGSALQKTDP